MADIIDIDSPITRLRREFSEQIAVKDLLLEGLTALVASSSDQVAAARAARDMLDILLLDFGQQIAAMRTQLMEMSANVARLRGKLPSLD